MEAQVQHKRISYSRYVHTYMHLHVISESRFHNSLIGIVFILLFTENDVTIKLTPKSAWKIQRRNRQQAQKHNERPNHFILLFIFIIYVEV